VVGGLFELYDDARIYKAKKKNVNFNIVLNQLFCTSVGNKTLINIIYVNFRHQKGFLLLHCMANWEFCVPHTEML